MWFKTILRRSRAAASQAIRPQRPATQQRFQVDEGLMRRLERLTIEANRALAGNPNSGEHPSHQQMPASIFSDHRPYSHGDDYRTIDWNAYARHEQIVIKLGEAEQDVNVHVLIDCSRSMAFGTPSKLVAAQRLAAAIGYVALSHSDRVRLTPFSGAALGGFGPAQSKARAIEMLRFVAAIQPQGETALAAALQRYARQHERGGLLVICSDLLTTTPADLEAGLRLLVPPRWQVLIAHLLDRREIEPLAGETIDLEDAETGERLPMRLDKAAIAAYQANLTSWQEQLAALCNKRGVSYAHIPTDWPFERAVLPYLRLRRVIQ